jgi:alcohol dehydrogenase class IV
MLGLMNPFSLECPPAIHFGAGALEKLAPLMKTLGHRILVVSGSRWFSSSPWSSRVMDSLGGVAMERLSLPAAEPSSRTLAAAREAGLRFKPDALVAVGGGSVMDSAKALSALLRHPGDVERFLEGTPDFVPIPGPCVPWVAVPTTAGTGAEVTKNAVIKSDAQGVKRSMRSPFLLAAAVIVDPLLTVSLPLEVTGTSGLDALTQLVESYVSRTTNAFVRSIVEGAFPQMRAALSGLPSDLRNAELRARASYGALVSGIALANGGLGAAHGFAAAVGGLFDVPHGLACAVFLPHVLAANAPVVRGQIARLAAVAVGADGPTLAGGPAAGAADASASSDPVRWLAEEVQRLLSAYGLPADLRGFRIPRDRLPEIADKSSGTSMRANPREISIEERIAILERVV